MSNEKTDKTTETTAKQAVPKKTGHTLPLVIAVLSVLIIGSATILYMNSSNIIKAAVEKIATQTLGVDVRIARLDISLPEKTVSVSGLSIANPKGFAKSHAITVGTIGITLESFSKKLITFDNILVDQAAINLEVTESGTNLTAIQNNIDRKASAKTSAAAEQKTNDQSTEEHEPIKVIIDNLLISKATLNPSMTLAGGDLASVTLPDIQLQNIGRKSNGVLASEAIGQILDQITKTSINTASQSGFLQGMSTESLKELQSSLGLSNSFIDKAKQDLESLKDGIKGLFGN